MSEPEPETQELSPPDISTDKNEIKNEIKSDINDVTGNDIFTFTFPLQLGGFFRFMFPPMNTIVSINDKCLCVKDECQPIKCIEKTVNYLNIRYTFYCDFYYNTDIIVSNKYNYLEIDIRDRGQPCIYQLTNNRKQKCIATLDAIFNKFNARKNEIEN